MRSEASSGPISLFKRHEQVREVCSERVQTQVPPPSLTRGQKLALIPPNPTELYDDFHLHIDRQGRITARSNQGDKHGHCELTIPSSIDLARALLARNTRDAELCQALGRQLYDQIFPKDIHTLIQETEAVARNNGHKIRIRLDIEAEELARLPLEFLYREDRRQFLAIDPRTALSRYLQASYPRNHVRLTAGPLHMLLIISSPSDQERLNINEWRSAVTQALEVPINQHLLTLDCIPTGTYQEITQAILRHKPNIIQFVGHGIYQNQFPGFDAR